MSEPPTATPRARPSRPSPEGRRPRRERGRFPWRGLALLLVGFALTRALPADGLGLLLRLAAATAVALLPGWLVARALGLRGAAASIAWGLAVVAVAAAVTFAVHADLSLVLALDLAAGAVALPFAVRASRSEAVPARAGRSGYGRRSPDRVWTAVAVAGAGLGLALYAIAGPVVGDAPFHLARVVKLASFDGLSLRAVGEFADGGLHPGYAFPLWHVLLALVTRLAGVDPSSVVRREAAVLVPVAVVLAYETGRAVFRSRSTAVAVTVAATAQVALAAGSGGAFRSLDLPASASRLLLVPAALTLFFTATRHGRRALVASTAAASLVLAFVHPTYALFLLLVVGGYLAVRALTVGREALGSLRPAAALALPAAAVTAWLYPVVRETASHDPAGAAARAHHGVTQYPGQIDVISAHSFRLAPETIARTGVIAVAALCLVPLAGLAGRRRWAALVLGGSLAVLAVMLVPFLFTHFSDAVSLSQSRRAAGFLPFAFAVAGGAAVLARLLGRWLLAVALAAGIALQLVWPGDFGYRLTDGGPAIATWIAAYGGVVGLVVAVARRRRAPVERHGALAATAVVLLSLPVAVHGFSHWRSPAPDPRALTPGLVHALRTRVPQRAIVLSDLETAYRVAAAAPVYVTAMPPAHVADTAANRPYERAAAVARFLRTGDLRLARSLHAGWIVVDRRTTRLTPRLPVVYRDARFVLYRLSSS